MSFHNSEIDAILGDSTILANRSQYVDFTATYTVLGIGTFARINHDDMWIFLKPLDVKLWLSIAGFSIITGFVIWAIESMDQESQTSPSQKIGPSFWFILMTLFFAQREKLSSNLSKFVAFVWLFLILIMISSYTATLSSLLTVEQFELASKGGTVGFHGGSFEADDYAMIFSEPSTSGFGFIFQKGSPLAKDMSSQIAKMREDGTLRLLEKKWFKDSLPLENSGIFLHSEVLIRVGVVLDMESWVGKSIHSFMSMAVSDFYALNNNCRTKIVLHTRDSKGDPFQTLSAVLDLLDNVKVQAIVGPETYREANLLAPIADKAKVPIFSFAGSPSMDYLYLFQIKEDESVMAKSIAALVKSYNSRDVIFLNEENDCGREILSYFLESFQDEGIQISQRIAVPALASDDQIIKKLQKVITSRTTAIIVHMSSLLANRHLFIAEKLGMVSEQCTWIVTYKTIDILQSVDNELIESLQGVIGLRSYIPASSKLLNLTARWYNECYAKYPTLATREVSVLAIWAYDTIWALAESIKRLEVYSLFVVPDIDSMLLNEVSKTRFKGVSGEFRLIDGNLVSNGFKVVNVLGNGGSTNTPKRRTLQKTLGENLKVGVLARRKFKNFIDVDIDNNVTTAMGFSVDVFNACIHSLPYGVPYELIPYGDETYDDLIQKVYGQEIDAILGDSTILENRSQYVDFTATYTDLGVGTLARINHNDMWIFLKPLDVDLWLITVGFAILTGIIIFAIEFMDQGSQRSPAQQIGSTFWLILMTLFFTQRKKLSSNLSKFVEFVWLLVVLILISSYTATLASLLTVEQFELASKGGTLGFHGGSFVAGVTVNNLKFEDYRHKPYYSYDDYAKALSGGGADAIIDEVPYIKMFLGKYSADYAMISSEPKTSGFAFIFQKGSPLATDMSRQIAKIRENGTLRDLEKKWFQKRSSSSQSKPKTLNFGTFRGLFLISGISSAVALMISMVCLLRAKLKLHSIISFLFQKNLHVKATSSSGYSSKCSGTLDNCLPAIAPAPAPTPEAPAPTPDGLNAGYSRFGLRYTTTY
nr:glutamate receptor 1.2-like [Tanacetum cinerariifolium]